MESVLLSRLPMGTWCRGSLPGVGPLHDELVLSVIRPTNLDSMDVRLPWGGRSWGQESVDDTPKKTERKRIPGNSAIVPSLGWLSELQRLGIKQSRIEWPGHDVWNNFTSSFVNFWFDGIKFHPPRMMTRLAFYDCYKWSLNPQKWPYGKRLQL